MKNIFIAFEGLPGTGKTTLAKKMTERFNGEYLDEIVNNDKYRPDQDEYYIESELIKLRRLSVSNKKMVFMDRCFLSMSAYNYGRKMIGLSDIQDKIERCILGTRNPDLIVYLRLNDLSLCNARKKRRVNEKDVWTRIDSLKYIKDFYERVLNGKENVITIDTDNQRMDEVEALLIKELQKYE